MSVHTAELAAHRQAAIREGDEIAGVAQPRSVVGAIWPLLLAVFVCQLLNPASAIFVGALAADFGVDTTSIGGMRAVSGVAALTVGFLVAPLLDRVPRGWTVCVGMALAALGSLLTLIGALPALVVSFFALGCAVALVMPAIQAAGGDKFRGPAAGQAASLVNAVQALSGVLSGPVLALPALVAGWQGAYLGMAFAAVLVTVFVGNIVTSRIMNVPAGSTPRWWRSPDQLLLASTLGMTVTVPLVYIAPSLASVVVATILFCITVGIGIASLVSVLMRQYIALRGPVMGLNATGQNVGLVLGTGLASVGLSVGGYVGLAITLALTAALAVVPLLLARRALAAAPTRRQDELSLTS